jgi:hypothetical protein
MDPLDTIFQHLDRWRHFPAYALERRTDIFFSVYLRGFLESALGVALEEEILPELPLKHGLVPSERESAQSIKVDFALFPKDRERVLFIELKTDPKSRRDRQDGDLSAVQQLGFRRVVEGIREILLHTHAYQKYYHLAWALEHLGFLRIPPEITSYLYPKPRQGLTRCLQAIQVAPLDPQIQVIYLQPVASGEPSCLGFEQLAAYVRGFSDPFSQRFAEHLLAWRATAGAAQPAIVREAGSGVEPLATPVIPYLLKSPP